jgi:polar amino acid transport system permease protein
VGILDILRQFGPGLLRGLVVTLKLTLTIWVIGIPSGVVLAIAELQFPRSVGLLGRGLAFVITSIPVIVLLFWFYYPFQTVLGLQFEPFVTAVVTLTLVNSFSVAELIRPAIAAFPQGYVAAAKVAGLRKAVIVRRIQLPFIAREVLPGVLFLQVVMLQATIFASLISLEEIFRITQQINAQIYRPVQVYSALAIFFLAICLPLNLIALLLQRRFRIRLSIE